MKNRSERNKRYRTLNREIINKRQREKRNTPDGKLQRQKYYLHQKEQNPERMAQQKRQYRLRNREKINKQRREYRLRNGEKLRRQQRENYRRNIEERRRYIRAANKKYYRGNFNEIREKKRLYRLNNSQYRENQIIKARKRYYVISRLVRMAREDGLWELLEREYENGQRSLRQTDTKPSARARSGNELSNPESRTMENG